MLRPFLLSTSNVLILVKLSLVYFPYLFEYNAQNSIPKTPTQRSTLLFVNTLKLLQGPFWHIFLLYFEKQMTFSRACGSRVVHKLLNKTMQKLSAKVSKSGHETTALFAFPNIHPCSQLHTKEPAPFYNTIELIKVLFNVTKIFFDLPSCYELHSALG